MKKIYFAGKPNDETIKYYEAFAQIVDDPNMAHVIVSSNFAPVTTDRDDVLIATNTTGLDHIYAHNAKIISLRKCDLTDFTAVPELCISMAGYLMRTFRRDELRGKVLGIIGYGRIGKRLAEYAQAIGMIVFFHDMYEGEANLETLLTSSDVVSLHITADEENRNWFNAEHFAMMKDRAIFLNSARPWLVDENALKLALDTKLACAWYDFEMPLKHANLVTTPHLGGATITSRRKSELLIAELVKEYIQTHD